MAEIAAECHYDIIKVANDPTPVPGYLNFGDNDFVKILNLL